MIEDDKRTLMNRLDEKKLEVQRITNMQLKTKSQVMIANHELNGKEIEITMLKL